ncbi:hypothetical protein HIM_01476 [Hirsutella minnesotensis 3608]|nr:hypothetical protein HIM_01476 [Hirsutella minnesotensis 3608]
MESICSFEPFWDLPDVISAPYEALHHIRTQALNTFLKNHRGKPRQPFSVENTIRECELVIQAILENTDDNNEVLQRLHDFGHHHQCGAFSIVQAALAMWYTSAAPVLARDPLQGLHPDSSSEVDESGRDYLPWSRSFSSKQHAAANLGIVAALMTSDRWIKQPHPLLDDAVLVSRSVTTLLYAVYLICPRMMDVDWTHQVELTRPMETIRTFLKSIWSLMRVGFDQMDAIPPGIEFGATLDEVTLSRNGMDIMTSIGSQVWHSPPYWHPLRRVPGSAWNKFLRNHEQPIFPESQSQSPGFRITIPGSLKTLSSAYQTYYFDLRSRMDQTGRARRVLTEEAMARQFHSLAAATGKPYPMMELTEDNASYTEEPEQDFLYKLPMIKKPITDMRGYLTFPFMNTLVRAWRFRQEPDEVDPDFHIMTFERGEDYA